MTKTTEIELAQKVIEWMRHDGWDIYEEVRLGYAGARADIVGMRHRISHVVEVKNSLSLAVIAQAEGWLTMSHYVSVAVPRTLKQDVRYQRDHARGLAHRICATLGIGVLEIDMRPGWKEVKEVVAPALNRTASKYEYHFIGNLVHEMHNEWGRAGSRNEYYTPFRQTCESLTEVVRDHPEGIRFKDAVNIIKADWHYHSEQSGRSALGKFLIKGGSKVLPRIDAQIEGRGYLLRYIEKE
jgi:hypothetical protein